MDLDEPEFPLLTRPDASTSKSVYERQPSQALPLSTKNPFIITKESGKNYARQYANIYFMRLTKMRNRVKARAEAKWANVKDAKELERVLDVDQGQMCWIIGTIYMDMKLKPNVIQEMAQEHNLIVPPPIEKMYSDEDVVSLEDASGRVVLVGQHIKAKRWNFVTGVIAAVLGAETATGEFEVVDMCFAGLPTQKALPLEKSEEESNWVALVSGMELGGNMDLDDFKADLLAEYLTGELAGESTQQESARISHLILAGNSMKQPTRIIDEGPAKKKKYGYDSSLYSAKPTQSLNRFLSTVLPCLNVTILPGDKDPTIPTMPQQPLHKALLPDAVPFGDVALQCETNPTWLNIDGLDFLGSSGQTIDDIYKYVEEDNRLDMVSSTLDWSHLAPTAPDTLWCYPFSERDPFVLTATPHVYFIGNQPEFATEIYQGEDGQQVRIILLPKFSETGQMVLVNTNSLQAKVITLAC